MTVSLPRLAAPAGSLLIHSLLVALLLLLGRLTDRPAISIHSRALTPPLLFPVDLVHRPAAASAGAVAAGGGAGHSNTPDSRGVLPPANPIPIVMPAQVRTNENPALEVPPALDLAAARPPLPQLDLSRWGDPLGQAGPPGNGRGRRGSGIGDGEGPGVGPGKGGPYGGLTAQAHTIGRGVTAPRLVYKIEPDYSDEARKARYQGSVMLRIIVDEAGQVRHVEIERPLGLGLDEKAVNAVRRWRFRPGTRDGKAVPVWANVEVYFRLL